jgi:hypothetical protein
MALLACVEGCPMLQRFLGVSGRESEICLCSWSSQIRRPLLSSWEYPAGFRSRNTVDTVEGKGRDSKVFIQDPRKRSLSRDELRR